MFKPGDKVRIAGKDPWGWGNWEKAKDHVFTLNGEQAERINNHDPSFTVLLENN